MLSRDQLLDLTQGASADSLGRSVDVLISRLRRKIERDPHDPEIIKTVRSGGYLFAAKVEAVVRFDIRALLPNRISGQIVVLLIGSLLQATRADGFFPLPSPR